MSTVGAARRRTVIILTFGILAAVLIALRLWQQREPARSPIPTFTDLSKTEQEAVLESISAPEAGGTKETPQTLTAPQSRDQSETEIHTLLQTLTAPAP